MRYTRTYGQSADKYHAVSYQLGAVNKEGNQRCIVSCRRMRCGSGETNCYRQWRI